MPAYVISDVSARDQAAFEAYRTRAADSIGRHDGRYIVRGGMIDTLEGDWQPRTIVIVEFPDMASLMGWYDSPEYSRLKAIRERCAKTRILALEGIVPRPS